MKQTKKLLTFGILALAVISTPLAARLGGAGASVAFLSMGAGSRPIGMGCAYTAMAEGPDALFWNPAGIAKLEAPAASFGQAVLFAGMLEENLAGVLPAGEGAVGLHVLAHLSGKIEVTTVDQQQGTGEFYTANNFAAGVTYSRRMTEKFTAGATVKLINLNIHRVSATGVAFDVGATYTLEEMNNLRLGFAIQHFGPDMRYSGAPLFFNTNKDTLQSEDIPANFLSEPFALPFTFSGGAAIDLVQPAEDGSGSRLTLEADFTHLADQPAKAAIGMEYGLNDMLFLRAGLGVNTSPGIRDTSTDTTQVQEPLETGEIITRVLSNRNDRGPSAGIGLKVPINGRVIDKTATAEARETDPGAKPIYTSKLYTLAVDYSFEWHWYLTPVHRASIGMTF